MYRIWHILSTYSLLLLAGALIGLFWANLDNESYQHLLHLVLWADAPVGLPAAGGGAGRELTLHFLVNDMAMAFFFAIAAKEVWEGLVLKEGELRGRKAMTPLVATLGGMAGPALVYLATGLALGVGTSLAQGWAIPMATDIAFSYLVGRMIFGDGHPAIRFLLLLAIADDAGGILVLAVFYPTGDLDPAWLLLAFGVAAAVYLGANRLPVYLDRGRADRPVSSLVRRRLGIWPYALAGVISWVGFHNAGIHPALGLLPVVAALPHADRPFGIFAEEETHQEDLLNWAAQRLKVAVEVILFFFGLLNAGVVLSALAEPTWMVLAGLLIGKPLGIFLFGLFAARVLGFGLPDRMGARDLFVLGCVAGIGFTVALFVATVAFPAGPAQEAAKMGAVLSFAAALVGLVAARLMGVRRHPG